MPETRGSAEVRTEIALERQRLADAVEGLRGQLGGTFDVRRQVSSHIGVLVPAAFAAGFVVSGGIGATMRYFARRGREHR